MITKEVHDRIHYGTGYKDGEFEELFIKAIENIQKYIDFTTKKE